MPLQIYDEAKILYNLQLASGNAMTTNSIIVEYTQKHKSFDFIANLN